jgi:hypothetical protein
MRQIIVMASVAMSAIGVLVGISEPGHTQAPVSTWTTAPSADEIATLGKPSQVEVPENPLPNGISLQGLGDVIKAMASRDSVVDHAFRTNAGTKLCRVSTRFAWLSR